MTNFEQARSLEQGDCPFQQNTVEAADFVSFQQLLFLAWRQGKNYLPCKTGSDRRVMGREFSHAESFTAMIVADLLIPYPEFSMFVRDVVVMLERELGEHEELFRFFKDPERLPFDADSTAVGFSVLLQSGACSTDMRARAHRSLDRISSNTVNGIVQTYFDPTGEREGIIDPVVCVNVLFLAHLLGRSDEFKATAEFVHQVLIEETFLEGSRYYHSPDSFLFFLGRLVHSFPEARNTFGEDLAFAVKNRLNISSHTIDVAQRAILCAWLGIDGTVETDELWATREGDGHWPADALFRSGRRPLFFGSRVMSTAFAVSALMETSRHYQPMPDTPSVSIRLLENL